MTVDRGTTDAEIIAASLNSPGAFEVLFDRHFESVHRYLVARSDRDVADDVAGETFCVAFQQRGRFDTQRRDARPWLLGIATNLLRRRWRSQRRRRNAYDRLRLKSSSGEPEPDPAAAVVADALSDPVATALRELNPGDREVLLLFAWGELSYDQIAEALDIPTGTVRSRLHRSRRQLRDRLRTDPENDRNPGNVIDRARR